MKRSLSMLIFAALALAGRGSTFTFTYDAAERLVNVNCGGSTNTAFGYDNNGNLLSQSTFVSGNPDLAVAQEAAPSPVVAGVSLHYVVTAFNNSSNVASGVVVTNYLPPNAALVSAVPSAGTILQNGSVLSWTLGSLTNGSSASMSIVVRPSTVGTVTNTAAISGALADPNPLDNTNVMVTAVLGRPGLVVGTSGPNLLLSWPLPGTANFTVQYTGSLIPPVTWNPDAGSIYIVGNQFYLAEPFATTNRFFRLSSPP